MDKLINFQEAADMLGISKRTFLRLVHKGIFPVVKVSARLPRIRMSDIEAYIVSSTVICSLPEVV